MYRGDRADEGYFAEIHFHEGSISGGEVLTFPPDPGASSPSNL